MAATCTTAGTQEQLCTDCGATREVPIEAKGHIWGEEGEITPATCYAEGTWGFVCEKCDATNVTETLPMQEHKLEMVENVEATEEQHGMQTFKCTAQGCSYTEWCLLHSRSGTFKLGRWDDVTEKWTKVDYDCQSGEMPASDVFLVRFCPVCEKNGDDFLANELKDLSVWSSAGDEGAQTVYHVGSEERRHFYTTVTDAEGKVTTFGIECNLCLSCGEYVNATWVSLTQLEENRWYCNTCQEEVEVSCDETGIDWCAICGHFSDNGTITTESTCEKTGVRTYTCQICGMVVNTMEIGILGHSLVEDTTRYKRPTEDEDGVTVLVCTREGCDYEQSQATHLMERQWSLMRQTSDGVWEDVEYSCKEIGYELPEGTVVTRKCAACQIPTLTRSIEDCMETEEIDTGDGITTITHICAPMNTHYYRTDTVDGETVLLSALCRTYICCEETYAVEKHVLTEQENGTWYCESCQCEVEAQCDEGMVSGWCNLYGHSSPEIERTTNYQQECECCYWTLYCKICGAFIPVKITEENLPEGMSTALLEGTGHNFQFVSFSYEKEGETVTITDRSEMETAFTQEQLTNAVLHLACQNYILSAENPSEYEPCPEIKTVIGYNALVEGGWFTAKTVTDGIEYWYKE